MTLKILNLYAGIGGNRKLWGGDIHVTAVELDPKIAKIYQDFFPNDKVIVADAHQFLLEHFKEFDFIWSSPPCVTHTKIQKLFVKTNGYIYPDMKLYEEIIFLQHFFKGKWVIENVQGYYDPLIKPYEFNSHYYWSNFIIATQHKNRGMGKEKFHNKIKHGKRLTKEFGINIKIKDRFSYKLINNCVNPKDGLHIFNMAFKDKQKTLVDL